MKIALFLVAFSALGSSSAAQDTNAIANAILVKPVAPPIAIEFENQESRDDLAGDCSAFIYPDSNIVAFVCQIRQSPAIPGDRSIRGLSHQIE